MSCQHHLIIRLGALIYLFATYAFSILATEPRHSSAKSFCMYNGVHVRDCIIAVISSRSMYICIYLPVLVCTFEITSKETSRIDEKIDAALVDDYWRAILAIGP